MRFVSRASLSRLTLTAMVASYFGWMGSASLQPALAVAPATCNGLTATIVVTTSAGFINGTTGDDVIVALNGGHTINGNGGNDTICGGNGSDVITTGSGNDWIDSGNGSDVIDAGEGNNTVYAGTGSDSVTTGGGNDYIDGGNGADVCLAGSGFNTVISCESGSSSSSSSSSVSSVASSSSSSVTSSSSSVSSAASSSSSSVVSSSSSSVTSSSSSVSSVASSSSSSVQSSSSSSLTDIVICHIIEGSFTETITISALDLAEHLLHGDTVGACAESSSSSSVNSSSSSSSVSSESSSSSSSVSSSSSSVSSSSSSQGSSSSVGEIDVCPVFQLVELPQGCEYIYGDPNEDGCEEPVGTTCDAPILSGSVGGEINDGNGSHRGERFNEHEGRIQTIGARFGLGGDVPPAGFGGTSRTPLSDLEIQYICSIQRAIPVTASKTLYSRIADAMATKMGRGADFVLEQLKDGDLCNEISAGLLPKAAVSAVQTIVIATDANGFPVSKNATWNACANAIYGNYVLTKEDIKRNTNEAFLATRTRKDEGMAVGCNAYFNPSAKTAYFPDHSVFIDVTDDKKFVFPKGYVFSNQEVAAK